MFRKRRKKIEWAAATTHSTRNRGFSTNWPYTRKTKKEYQDYNSSWDLALRKQIEDGPPSEGYRHAEMLEIGPKMVWGGYPQAKTEEGLIEFFDERYGGGLKLVEIKDAVKWIFKKTTERRDDGNGSGSIPSKPKRPKPKAPSSASVPTVPSGNWKSKVNWFRPSPDPVIFHHCSGGYINHRTSQQRLFKAMFRPDEYVAVRTDSYASPAEIKTRREWERINIVSESGAWFNINPLKGTELVGGNPSKEDIAIKRHVVLDFDDELPLDKQLEVLGNFIPDLLAILWTAGRGYHGIVKIGAETNAECMEAVKYLKELSKPLGFDHQPIGFHASSRVPNCKRGDDFQDLVYLNPNPSPTPIFKDQDGLPARWYDRYERVGLMKGGINNE
jgi:hypothetical protein